MRQTADMKYKYNIREGGGEREKERGKGRANCMPKIMLLAHDM